MERYRRSSTVIIIHNGTRNITGIIVDRYKCKENLTAILKLYDTE